MDKMKRQSGRKCCVCGTTKRVEPLVRLFCFPKASATSICDKHFPPYFCNKKTIKKECYVEIERILKENNELPDNLNTNIAKKKIRWRKCVLKHCENSLEPPICVRFFTFPADKDLCRVWKENCGINENIKKNTFLCSRHFHSHDIFKKQLKRGAIPLFYLKRETAETTEIAKTAEKTPTDEDSDIFVFNPSKQQPIKTYGRPSTEKLTNLGKHA